MVRRHNVGAAWHRECEHGWYEGVQARRKYFGTFRYFHSQKLNQTHLKPEGYRAVARGASSLLQYGITPIDSAKTDVTMQFYVENQL